MDVNDIECVVFERVLFGIKNFDMAIIFKDFTTHKRINSIPIEHMEELKSYLDEICIIYAESEAPFNWNTLLSHIRENFDDWLEEGAWGFLLDPVSNHLIMTTNGRRRANVMMRMVSLSAQRTKTRQSTTMTRRIPKTSRITQTSATKKARMSTAKSSVKKASAGKNSTSRPRRRTAKMQPSVATCADLLLRATRADDELLWFIELKPFISCINF